jgi:hypothetical protein
MGPREVIATHPREATATARPREAIGMISMRVALPAIVTVTMIVPLPGMVRQGVVPHHLRRTRKQFRGLLLM